MMLGTTVICAFVFNVDHEEIRKSGSSRIMFKYAIFFFLHFSTNFIKVKKEVMD